MKLLNFSIGKVRQIDIDGSTVATAHIKEPAPEPWLITERGAQGDERAVHPDKLYAFARQGYAFWGQHLDRDAAAWPDGYFGENLTLDVLDEEEIRVGDIFAIGDAVKLIVSGARTPCAKLAWRLGQPLTFQKTFALSGHTGVYFDVVRPGTVAHGQELRRIGHDPSMPSAVDYCRFVASRNPLALAPLKKLLAFKQLSPAGRLILGAKLEAAERASSEGDEHWAGWREFIIERIDSETPEIRSFYLRPNDGKPLSKPRPGQFVSVRMALADGHSITRSWSISHHSIEMQQYRLTIKMQDGPGSAWMHRAPEGSTVMLRSPVGHFALDTGGFRPVVLVAAGIGITPLLAMLHAHLARAHPPPIYLIYGGRTPDDLAFRKEIEALADTHGNFRLHYIYSRFEYSGRPPSRITSNHVIEALSDLHIFVGDHRVDLPWHESDIYICGPGDFCTAMTDALIFRGGNPDRIFSEKFIAHPASAAKVEECLVRFQRSGRVAAWKLSDDLTLLELAEEMGIDVNSDCRAGSCLTCRSTVLVGATTADVGENSCLLCIGQPKTSTLALDL